MSYLSALHLPVFSSEARQSAVSAPAFPLPFAFVFGFSPFILNFPRGRQVIAQSIRFSYIAKVFVNFIRRSIHRLVRAGREQKIGITALFSILKRHEEEELKTENNLRRNYLFHASSKSRVDLKLPE